MKTGIAEDGPGEVAATGSSCQGICLDLRYGSNKSLARAQHYRKTVGQLVEGV